MQFSRREFLDFASRASVAGSLGMFTCQRTGQEEFTAIVPFINEGGSPLDQVFGEGLGGRLSYDLTRLNKDDLIIPNDEFYIRTRVPDRFPQSGEWTISVHGLVEKPHQIFASDLEKKARSQGAVLLECSGNSAFRHFGLLSAARWSGVKIEEVLKTVTVQPGATHLLVSGFDDHSKGAEGSVKGASWVFALQDLVEAGAFLATGMNGQALPPDHGWPVRLMVPNWYGCACIKWVNGLKFIGGEEIATSQMQEFAARTHQLKVHRLAIDYLPAEIDLAAMPVRVEQWKKENNTTLRIIGIKWGIGQEKEPVELHIQPIGQVHRIEDNLAANAGWTLWQFDWEPPGPGQFELQLRAVDKKVRTRRLDNGYYSRSIVVSET